jgi:YD repeat-containing protein
LLGHRKYAHYGSATGTGVDYTYDTAMRLHTEAASGRTLTYQSDANGNRSQITFPDSNWVSYTYDAANRMYQVQELGATSGPGLLATYSYDSLGRRGTITRGNGTSTTFTYQPGTNLLGSIALGGSNQNLTRRLPRSRSVGTRPRTKLSMQPIPRQIRKPARFTLAGQVSRFRGTPRIGRLVWLLSLSVIRAIT